MGLRKYKWRHVNDKTPLIVIKFAFLLFVTDKIPNFRDGTKETQNPSEIRNFPIEATLCL